MDSWTPIYIFILRDLFVSLAFYQELSITFFSISQIVHVDWAFVFVARELPPSFIASNFEMYY
jgi:hypothetical protein